jgi:hypothetical protein
LDADDFLLKYTAVRALPGVPPRYHESVQNWVAGNAPLRRGEDTFLENRDDFITARWTPETKNIVEDLVERLATWSPGSRINVSFLVVVTTYLLRQFSC